MLEIGQDAPQFSLGNQDDIEMSLKVFKGKWIILYFYPKDNTPGCTTEACEFTASLPEFEDIDAVVLGVSPDSTKSHRNFIAKKEIGFTLLSDPEKDVIRSYGAWGPKKLYGKEYEGVIRSTFIISPDQKIAASWSKVRVKGHVETVKDKLNDLQN